ncbi:hypothetical protein SISNIDRAFT_323946 [Sistotremastrum niveocremeum HHB9708]|uniref:GH16 domain-containing protein n=1 Tax=Sistotremastrum niveocremeum HHB9708 TaxID=1314777 RepID=A0A164MT48_9AGAM|nr:hypothetical protein SISNIDRAFT_323946 [Sistotremastrum niveocremeum HHB9708]
MLACKLPAGIHYSGSTFFDSWNFYGSWDNLTLGDTWWVNENDAFTQNLAFVNGAGNAVLKVDNSTNVPWNTKRNSIRITTTDTYNFGSLWIIDVLHLPFGCSVWPAFWSFGPDWPVGGEIDTIEGVNMMQNNQMALHTDPGCILIPPSPAPPGQGIVGETDCSTAAGCVYLDQDTRSYGQAFADNGGGVWATQFDVSGVFIWFWSRSDVPPSISSAGDGPMDISQWGPPTASYPNGGCDMAGFFAPQQLVLDITLCGDWAGLPQVYNATCANTGPTGVCYLDNVVGPGSHYDDAYFEINNLKTYTTFATPAATGISAGSKVKKNSAGRTQYRSFPLAGLASGLWLFWVYLTA